MFALEVKEPWHGYASLTEIGSTECADKQVIDRRERLGGLNAGLFRVSGDKCPPVGESE